jgi:hypothetical protein
MSFLYPRTITIARPAAQSGEGALAYGGRTAPTDTPVLATPTPAAIQSGAAGGKGLGGLPGGGTGASWRILIPAAAGLTLGSVREHDIVTDDLGEMYQVTSDGWDSLGYALGAEKVSL